MARSQIHDWQSALSLAREERPAIAFLEYDRAKDESAIQKGAEEFIVWVCWLLSLAELLKKKCRRE